MSDEENDEKPVVGSHGDCRSRSPMNRNVPPPTPSSENRPQPRPRSVYDLAQPGTSSESSLPPSAFRRRVPDVTSASEVERGPNESLREFLARKKALLKNPETPEDIAGDTVVQDPYDRASRSINLVHRKTAIITDPEFLLHKCEWDTNYPENPARLEWILNRLSTLGLTPRCENIENILHNDLFETIKDIHDEDMFFNLHRISLLCQRDMEREARLYDSIYFNDKTFISAKRALSASLNLASGIAKGEYLNGFALVRPPGHHAMRTAYNGYCMFNNVAVTADYLIKKKLAKKVLIVDFDVHHGQGTQQAFYDRDDVLYFSIHRYENGAFWPNLFESNFNFIGSGRAKGYNINVPLNVTGLGDAEYLAIFMTILLPIAYEFKPDFVLISAGFDAAVGCPEGKMNVTPACYHHMIQLLSGLAEGRICVCLEGGYFLPSLAEAAASTLKGLLGDPAPLLDQIGSVHPKVIETMANLKRMLVPFWNCMKVHKIFEVVEVSEMEPGRKMEIKYFGKPLEPPYPTRDCYPLVSEEDKKYFEKIVESLMEKDTHVGAVDLPVCYFYEDAMLKHKPAYRSGEGIPADRPERPERLTKIMEKLDEMGVLQRLVKVAATARDFSEYDPHAQGYVEGIPSSPDTSDVYKNEHTLDCIKVAVSGLMNVVDEVMQDRAKSGIAIIRPPGHHAEFTQPAGFCLVNNVAVAANYLTERYGLERVLIVDFDIHHGNGTQQLFYTSSNVMYVSLHRFDDGKYFPHGSHGNYTYDGYGNGKGYNVNVPFNHKKMGNSEYLCAFFNVVLPIAYSYQPQFILVSAGFDAGIHDPLGGYLVTPEAFGHMVNLLKPLARGKLVLTLEGGYNWTTTSYSLTMCAKALLGDPLPQLDNLFKMFENDGISSIRHVANHFKLYFPILEIMRPLPCVPVIFKSIDKFEGNIYDEFLSKYINMDLALDSDYVEAQMDRLNNPSVTD